METTIDSIEFAPVNQSQHGEALSLLVAEEPASERAGRIATLVTALRQGDIFVPTFVGATRSARLLAAAWGQILPGKTALLWPPRIADNEHETIGDRLQEYLDSRLKALGISMAQAVLPSRAHPDAERLERVGYRHAADLLYLVSQWRRDEVSSTEFDIDFVPYTRTDQERLSAIVERTYVNTLDVPALNGVRDMRDVLNGYELTGHFSPDRWFFLQSNGQDIGCLLLTDHTAQQQWELVYMGIIPEFRGNGWGSQATRFARQLAKQAGRDRLILAVDAANDPAISAYTQAGFFELLRRSVLLKTFAE